MSNYEWKSGLKSAKTAKKPVVAEPKTEDALEGALSVRVPDDSPEPTTARTNEVHKPSATDVLAEQLAQLAGMMVASQKQTAESISALSRRFDEMRTETRSEGRPTQRPEARSMSNTTTAIGRNGEVIVRRAVNLGASSPFDLPPEFIQATLDEEYSLEWKTEYVYNEPRSAYLARLSRDGGWSPVPNSRLPGLFTGDDDEAIRHEGMILMERPLKLTAAARREEQIASQEQLLLRQRNWGVESKNPAYFNPNHPGAKSDTILRSTRETSDPSWAPNLTIDSEM